MSFNYWSSGLIGKSSDGVCCFSISVRMRATTWGFSAATSFDSVMYANGEGVEKDVKEAVWWLHMAAEQGVAPAQSALKELEKK